MSRIEENEKVIEEVVKITNDKSSGTYEEVVTLQLNLIAFMLGDISKSLAVIADELEKEDKDDKTRSGSDIDNDVSKTK